MQARETDIAFADNVARMLRASVQPDLDTDLYWRCMNAERVATAALYERAAESMRQAGKWAMPTTDELEAAKREAWAVLQEEAP
jgi:hypothetical protein